MTTVAPIAPVVKPTPAQDNYRQHVMGDCWACGGGHWCAIRDRLDYLAACEDTRRSKGADRG